MLKNILVISIVFVGFQASAQETIKTMFYNLLEYPSASSVNRDQTLQSIIDTYEPDIFMVCELESQQGADLILNVSLNDEGANYTAFPFIENTSGEADLQQLLFYRSNMFTVETSEIIATDVRDINRYQLKLNTADGATDPVLLDFYVAHLKSSQGSSNEAQRLDMVTEFTNTLSNLDPNSFVFFAGDLNFYDAGEPGYIELLDDTNAIRLVDPIDMPGDWNNNEAFQAIHTQSTRISSGGFGAGAGGGMDDRFDFILISENMLTNPVMRYVPDTYKSYGNNGNCYNLDVRDPGCTGEFSQELRNNIYSMSDHLPVVMELETNKQIILATEEFEVTEAVFQLEKTIVSEALELTFAQTPDTAVTIEIYNTLGQKVLIETSQNQTSVFINVSSLAEGVYYLKTNLNTTQTIKFLKIS
ncbi:T9SS type A sorting domain-containing protein [Jejudonia soesokkakensis]|uniref:T9SS type A sorting domain-containing protein n=1 Tax=Jejudonia soesokkakensis TaxID=1323432 RepID=A0ABW2MRC4_9FLAO